MMATEAHLAMDTRNLAADWDHVSGKSCEDCVAMARWATSPSPCRYTLFTKPATTTL